MLNEYYNAAGFFVFLSQKEPLGLVGLEAMAAGIMVIGANVGGIPDYIEDGVTGFLFEKENTIDLAEKIMFVLKQDAAFLQPIYKNTKPVVRSHSLKRSSEKIVSLLKSVIQKNIE